MVDQGWGIIAGTWQGGIGGDDSVSGRPCSPATSAGRWKDRGHGGYQAFKLSASSCKATLLDQIGTEFGLWRLGRVGTWAVGKGSSRLVK